MIIQQRLIPQQGMDPVQQKMMMWMMPGIFTFMMLFLPAALGVYMLTNSALGISQQLPSRSSRLRRRHPRIVWTHGARFGHPAQGQGFG